MNNPWIYLSLNGPEYILDEDKDVINNYNRNKNENVKIQSHLLPEAYLGNPKADIVILHANPGFVKQEIDYSNTHKELMKSSLKNMRHEDQEYPIYLLDERFHEDAGYIWWMKQTKQLREKGNITTKQIANSIFQVEFFPYHSKNVGLRALPKLKSQEYSFYLVREAIKRNAIILEMRGFYKKDGVPLRSIWVENIPELKNYKKLFRPSTWRAAALSEANLGKDVFNQLVDTIRK